MAWSPGVMGVGLSAGVASDCSVLERDSGHGVAVELGFSLQLPMLLFPRTAFLLHLEKRETRLILYVLSFPSFW